jgi:hypothetical protein
MLATFSFAILYACTMHDTSIIFIPEVKYLGLTIRRFKMQLKHWTFLVGICYRFDLRKGTRLLICKKAIIEHTYDSYNKGSGLS